MFISGLWCCPDCHVSDGAEALPLNTAERVCVVNYPLLHLTSLSACWGLVEPAVMTYLIGGQ